MLPAFRPQRALLYLTWSAVPCQPCANTAPTKTHSHANHRARSPPKCRPFMASSQPQTPFPAVLPPSPFCGPSPWFDHDGSHSSPQNHLSNPSITVVTINSTLRCQTALPKAPALYSAPPLRLSFCSIPHIPPIPLPPLALSRISRAVACVQPSPSPALSPTDLALLALLRWKGRPPG